MIRPRGKVRGGSRWWVGALIVTGAALTGLNAYKNVFGFGASFHDFGVIESAIQNTALGDPVPLRPADREVSHLATHFHLVLWPVAWLNRVIPDPHLYAWLAAATWFGVMLATGRLVFAVTGDLALAALAGTALFFNVYSRRLFFSGHYEHVQGLFGILAALAWSRRRPRAMAGWLLTACTVREDAALFAACLGAGLASESRDKSLRVAGVVAALGALGWFGVVWLGIMPALGSATAGPGRVELMAGGWGGDGSLAGAVTFLLGHPGRILRAIFSNRVGLLLAGFGFMPLLAPRFFLLACLPPILVQALSAHPAYAQFRYHTSSAFLGALAVGMALGLARLRTAKLVPPRTRRLAPFAAAVLALAVGGWNRPDPRFQKDCWRFGLTLAGEPNPVDARARAVHAVLYEWPWGGHSVAAGMRTLQHLPPALNHWWFGEWQSRRAEWVVLDEIYEGPVMVFLTGSKTFARLSTQVESAGYRRHEPVPGLLIFERRAGIR